MEKNPGKNPPTGQALGCKRLGGSLTLGKEGVLPLVLGGEVKRKRKRKLKLKLKLKIKFQEKEKEKGE